MKKASLIERTDKQLECIETRLVELQANLKLLKQKTFRKKQLNILELLVLISTLNRVSGILYSCNLFCNNFLIRTGKKN